MLSLRSCLVLNCLFVSMFAYGTALTEFANVSSSCTPEQTPCPLGCCPYYDGVCCADGYECCQHGQTCIPFIGICVGLEDKNGETSLVSSKSTSLENLITSCPAGWTQCSGGGCCRFPHATCCKDGLHCCPHGYTCDLVGRKCVRDSINYLGTKLDPISGPVQVSPLKMTPKSQYKSCPGSNQVCPSYTSCCINDKGEWSCCPNPSLPQIKYGGGDCCDTIWGHMCCPDSFPHCTPIGCMA